MIFLHYLSDVRLIILFNENRYALLDGINDTFKDMQDLMKLVEGLPAHINLVPVNLWPEKGFHASPIDKAMGYLHEFQRLGISCSIRTPPRFPTDKSV